MALNDKTKILALAHLKTGKRPKEVSELIDISYAQAIKLSKELAKAEAQDTLHELFSLEQAALDTLLETVDTSLSPAVEVLSGDNTALTNAISTVSQGVNNAGVLEQNLQIAALELSRKITAQALSSTGVESLLILTEALAKLQTAFFAKGTNVQINNLGSSFEQYLSD